MGLSFSLLLGEQKIANIITIITHVQIKSTVTTKKFKEFSRNTFHVLKEKM